MLEKTLFAILHPLWRLYDLIAPKRADHWAFTTHHLHTDRFIENQRAVFEHVKTDPAIRKLVFYRNAGGDFQIENAVNCETVKHGTLRGLILLARCKVVFLTHSIAMDYSLRWPGKGFSVLKLALRKRVVVNLWHSISVKKLLYVANEEISKHTARVSYRTQERLGYAGLIASSDIDSYAMSAMFYPLNYRQVWITGLPRNDFLTQPENVLPRYIRSSLERLRGMSRGRKLIVYAPTYRQTHVCDTAHYYQFSDAEIARLKNLLRASGAILGYRPHYFKNSKQHFNLDQYIDDELIFDMSQDAVPEFSALARECDLLITDYSSVYIETLYLGKPVICFGYDIDHYKTHEDGLLYDMDLVFPGPVVQHFDELMDAVESRLHFDPATIAREQATARRIFFKHSDARNAHRVKEEVLKRL